MSPIPSEPNVNILDSKVVFSTRYVDHNKQQRNYYLSNIFRLYKSTVRRKLVSPKLRSESLILQTNSQGSAKYALQPNVNIPESKMMCSTIRFTSNFATTNYPIDSTNPVGGNYCITSSEVIPIPWNQIQKAMLDGSIMSIPESKLLYSTMRITSYKLTNNYIDLSDSTNPPEEEIVESQAPK